MPANNFDTKKALMYSAIVYLDDERVVAGQEDFNINNYCENKKERSINDYHNATLRGFAQSYFTRTDNGDFDYVGKKRSFTEMINFDVKNPTLYGGTRQDWNAVLKSIDPGVYIEDIEKTESGATCYLLKNSKTKEAIFVFKASDKNEVRKENIMHAGSLDENDALTTQQKECIEAVERIYKRSTLLKYSDYSVNYTGYGDGGNLAITAAVVLADKHKTDKVITSNSQGFPDAFCKKYRDNISRIENDITNCSPAAALNNVLLNPIGRQRFLDIYSKNKIEKNFDTPMALLKANEMDNLIPFEAVEQNKGMKQIGDLSRFIVRELDEETKRIFLDYIGHFSNCCISSKKLDDFFEKEPSKEEMDALSDVIGKIMVFADQKEGFGKELINTAERTNSPLSGKLSKIATSSFIMVSRLKYAKVLTFCAPFFSEIKTFAKDMTVGNFKKLTEVVRKAVLGDEDKKLSEATKECINKHLTSALFDLAKDFDGLSIMSDKINVFKSEMIKRYTNEAFADIAQKLRDLVKEREEEINSAITNGAEKAKEKAISETEDIAGIKKGSLKRMVKSKQNVLNIISIAALKSESAKFKKIDIEQYQKYCDMITKVKKEENNDLDSIINTAKAKSKIYNEKLPKTKEWETFIPEQT